jgi:outer membrane biosynthesis protein TonB
VFVATVLRAVRTWRYRPRIVAGQAVDQRVVARLRFELTGG